MFSVKTSFWYIVATHRIQNIIFFRIYNIDLNLKYKRHVIVKSAVSKKNSIIVCLICIIDNLDIIWWWRFGYSLLWWIYKNIFPTYKLSSNIHRKRKVVLESISVLLLFFFPKGWKVKYLSQSINRIMVLSINKFRKKKFKSNHQDNLEYII